MAEFVAFDKNAEVLGNVYLSIVEAVPAYRRANENLLSAKGISAIDPEKWHSHQNLLDILRFIKERIGSHTLFAIGKAIVHHSIFPEEVVCFESALNNLNAAYYLNHRNGNIGYYRVLALDYETKTAMIECCTPYPLDFERGLLTALCRKYKPAGASLIDVELDLTQPSRRNGAESDVFIISW